jgi:hypothetical protein
LKSFAGLSLIEEVHSHQKPLGFFINIQILITPSEGRMKTLQKIFTAICLITIAGLVGCAKPDSASPKSGDKTESQAPLDDGPGSGKTESKKTEPQKTTPDEGNPTPTPDVDPDIPAPNAQSGSTEKKGGVDIPQE